MQTLIISNKPISSFFACCPAFRENDSGLIDWPAMKFLDNYAYIKAKKYGTDKYHISEPIK